MWYCVMIAKFRTRSQVAHKAPIASRQATQAPDFDLSLGVLCSFHPLLLSDWLLCSVSPRSGVCFLSSARLTIGLYPLRSPPSGRIPNGVGDYDGETLGSYVH